MRKSAIHVNRAVIESDVNVVRSAERRRQRSRPTFRVLVRAGKLRAVLIEES